MRERYLQDASMCVNNTDLAGLGVIVESYKIGPTEVTNDIFQGRNRTGFNVLSSVFGMREIAVNLFFQGKTRREVTLKKSQIDGMMFGELDLLLPDGLYYNAVLDKAGELQILGVQNTGVIALSSYTFRGICHDPLVTATGNTVYCTSTMPQTSCRLTCTASQDYASITIDTVTITNVRSGDVLVVDGIDGRILQNGAPCAGNMSFQHLPALVPGKNVLTCPEILTVEYYPTYI